MNKFIFRNINNKLNILVALFLVVISSCFLITEPRKGKDLLYFNIYGQCYNPQDNTLDILGDKYENVYQLSTSQNMENFIFSTIKNYGTPELFIKGTQIEDKRIITPMDGLIFDPVINDNGEYAFAHSENSWSLSNIYLNNIKLDLPGGLYHNLIINNKYLASIYTRHDDDTNWIIIVDLSSGKMKIYSVDLIPENMFFLEEKIVVFDGFENDTFYHTIKTLNIVNGVVETIHKGNETVSQHLEGVKEGSIILKEINTPSGRLKYYIEKEIIAKDPLNTIMCGNNYLGRLSWNGAYRLEVLITLSKNRNLVVFDQKYPLDVVIKHSIESVIMNVEEHDGFLGWPTKRYSMDGNTKLLLLVDDARILYPLLMAVNANLTSSIQKEKIISIAEALYQKHDSYYDQGLGIYRFKKGINFWADGVWLPFNMQNVFGLCLIEMYKATGNIKYKKRVFELAESFKKEWTQAEDNNTIWHYWPKKYYDGWTVEDDISINTPNKEPSDDLLFEDVSHAGLNVKFVLEFESAFPDSIFNSNDIRSISAIIDRIKYGEKYSCFISGDIVSLAPSKRFIPRYGWSNLNITSLNLEISKGIPRYYPLFEQDKSLTFINAFIGLITTGYY